MLTILDLLRARNLEPRRAGGQEWACACPVCGGTPPKSDRFRVFVEQNNGQGSYWCRRCGIAGDVVQFLRDVDALSFQDACRQAGVPPSTRLVPIVPRLPLATGATWHPVSHPLPSAQWQSHAAKFLAFAQEQLARDGAQLAYLAGRGLPKEAVQTYGLGYNPEDAWRSRQSWGLPPVTTDRGTSKRLWISAGIVIPVFHGAELVRLKIRRPKPSPGTASPTAPHLPPYPVVEGSGMATMVLGAALPAFVVTEAELDAMACHWAAGDFCGAIALGSCKIAPDLPTDRLLRQAQSILVNLDADEAGAAAWWDDSTKLRPGSFTWRRYPQAKRWLTPVAKDPGEAVAQGEDLRAWLFAGMPQGYARVLALPVPACSAPGPCRKGIFGEGGGDQQASGVGHLQEVPISQPSSPSPPHGVTRLRQILARCSRRVRPVVVAAHGEIALDCGRGSASRSRHTACGELHGCGVRREALGALYGPNGGEVVDWVEQHGWRAS